MFKVSLIATDWRPQNHTNTAKYEMHALYEAWCLFVFMKRSASNLDNTCKKCGPTSQTFEPCICSGALCKNCVLACTPVSCQGLGPVEALTSWDAKTTPTYIPNGQLITQTKKQVNQLCPCRNE